MKVEIIFKDSSTPKTLDAYSVYTKGGLLCFMLSDRKTLVKYPLCNVFSIVHEHRKHGGSSPEEV
jgi:hypothetical protein